MWKVFSLEMTNHKEMPYKAALLMQTTDKAEAFAFASCDPRPEARLKFISCVLINPDGNVEGGW